jgi:acylphosphatase
MRKRMRVLVSGRVQGVGYRAFVVRFARALGLHGSVRNLPTGQVEVIAEGDEPSLSHLLSLLRQGPPASRVTDVQAEWSNSEGEGAGFYVIS